MLNMSQIQQDVPDKPILNTFRGIMAKHIGKMANSLTYWQTFASSSSNTVSSRLTT